MREQSKFISRNESFKSLIKSKIEKGFKGSSKEGNEKETHKQWKVR